MIRNDFLLDLETLLGSVSKIRMLKTLYKLKNIEMSISSLAKDAGISVNQAKLIVDDYRNLKIIKTRVEGNCILVALKQDTIYFDLIKAIMQRYIGAHDRLMTEISKKTKDAWIFGSYARNELKRDSDIDILTKETEVVELSSYFLKDISVLHPKGIRKDLLKKIRKEGLKVGKDR
ncbi:MAG: nucleotidyltransferase family protein [Nanoarchaeota archaeon]